MTSLRTVLLLFLTMHVPTVLWGTTAAAQGADRPPMQRGADLADCVGKLEGQGGGWCEIRAEGSEPGIGSVYPEGPVAAEVRCNIGPKAVLFAWTGAAWDPETRRMYFWGGGHGDYCGNEVYEFDFDSGRWSRLTDPSPLDFYFSLRDPTPEKSGKFCRAPDMRKVPGSAHSYDGIQFSTRTGTIFLAMLGAATGKCFEDKDRAFENSREYRERMLWPRDSARGQGVFEFNPSRDETRNGLAPLTWRRVYTPGEDKSVGGPLPLSYPRSVEIPADVAGGGGLGFGDRTAVYAFDPVTHTRGGGLFGHARAGDSLAIFYRGTKPGDEMIVGLTNAHLIRKIWPDGVSTLTRLPWVGGKALAERTNGPDGTNGLLFLWDGKSRVATLDPRDKEPTPVFYEWGPDGPPAGDVRVYSKWQYVPDYDVFVGVTTPQTGVWIYKHPVSMEGSHLSTVNPQRLVSDAVPGSTVTIPPGLYTQGLLVDKSMTLKLKDARFWGVAKHKGIINVKCNGCSVVIEDFHAEGRRAGCLGGNCAGIKVEGKDFDLTVRRAHIDNTVMGILTDNRGGRVTLEDSLVENIGLEDNSREVAHGIYAGLIDSIVVRNTTIRNVNGDGHLFKSRARHTELENVRLLGGEGYHSRSIDFPCGGTLEVHGSVIQHGENTDNPDVIAVGTEPRSCGEIQPANVSITDSWLVVDRDRSADERARTYGPNFLFRWRSPLVSLNMKNNRIVNVDEWSTKSTESGDVTIPDQSAGNRICASRSACDLPEGALPEM